MPLDANPPRTKGAGKTDRAWIGAVNRAPEWGAVHGIFGDIPCVSTSAPPNNCKAILFEAVSSFGVQSFHSCVKPIRLENLLTEILSDPR